MSSDELSGILLVDKPVGITSATAVNVVKRRLKLRKVGHLGTLDPFASGLLPVCVGQATKIARFLASAGKAYSGVIKLGEATDTLDCTGAVVERQPVGSLDLDALARVRRSFTGRLKQKPPMFSAVKRGGVPLYKLARRGVEVERSDRDILVHNLQLAIAAPDSLALFVECSKGTYVRVLAYEIARALGTCGHLTSLRRTGFGQFSVSQAVALDVLGAPGCQVEVVSPAEALSSHRRFVLDARSAALVRQGQQQVLWRLEPAAVSGEVACLLDGLGVVVAVLEATGEPPRWKVARVLGGQSGPAGGRLYKDRAAW